MEPPQGRRHRKSGRHDAAQLHGWYGPGTIAIADGELRRFTFYEVAPGEA